MQQECPRTKGFLLIVGHRYCPVGSRFLKHKGLGISLEVFIIMRGKAALGSGELESLVERMEQLAFSTQSSLR